MSEPKVIKLTEHQVQSIQETLTKSQIMLEEIATLYENIIARYVQVRTDVWDQAAKLAGYENSREVYKEGKKLQLKYITAELLVLDDPNLKEGLELDVY